MLRRFDRTLEVSQVPTFTRASESIVSPADLLAFAAEQSANEASCYVHAAEAARARGTQELAELLEILAKREPADRGLNDGLNDGKAERVRGLLPPGLAEADSAMEEATRSALLTPYRALALAVEEAQRHFRTFAHIAALAEPADVRREAERLARNELVRAAALRGARRRAYHAERPSDMPAPATLAELRLLSATWEPVVGAPDEAKRLEQAFEKYLAVAEHARDEAVLAEAQARAAEILHRMLRATHAEAPSRDS
jgi:hypothetical protein